MSWLKPGMAELKTNLSSKVQVFVYGTLKPDQKNYQRYCADKVLTTQRATTLGQLFALPMGYPAMRMGNDTVHGYLLAFADLKVLDALDELEDYQPTREMSENLYNRQEVEVYDLQGVSLGRAWVYLMNPEKITALGGTLLPDGCWAG